MQKQNLFRIALVLRDSSNTTRDKKLCDVVCLVLTESPEPALSAVSIAAAIERDYGLTFDPLEIEFAIRRKGKVIQGGRNGYSLPESEKKKVRSKESLQAQLDLFVQEYYLEYPDKKENEIDLSELLYRYIYFCFSKSTSNLLFLLQGVFNGDKDSFEASSEEIAVLDDFITWDNPHKNELLYSIVSCCYEYCMLSVKKNTISVDNLFFGKRFYLDANIIFRLAGFNNDEREYVTKMFVKKCREAKIELIITDKTYTEINRVIDGQISWIKGFTKGQAPIKPEALQKIAFTYKANDFYALYYSWCQSSGNHFNDYNTFRSYLYNQIREVLSTISYEDTDDFSTEKQDEFENLVIDLYRHKYEHYNNPTRASLETDINNLLYVRSVRRASSAKTIWGTNQFQGVPLVVIPSVWLSILLKLTGRAEDDYKAFCSFLRLPAQGSQTEVIDADMLTEILSKKTTEAEVKERIITELVQNSGSFTFDTPDDYVAAVDGAFDIILRETTEEHKKQIEASEASAKKQLLEQQEKSAEERAEAEEKIRQDVKAQTRTEIVEQQILKQTTAAMRKIDRADNFSKVLYALLAVTFLVLFYLAFNETKISQFFLDLLPKGITSQEAQLAFIGIVLAIIPGLIGLVYHFVIRQLKSEDHKKHIEKKIREKVEKEFSE